MNQVLFLSGCKCMDAAKRKARWSPVNVRRRQTSRQPEVEHEDHLTLHLSFKATLKRISDLDYPEMRKRRRRSRRPTGTVASRSENDATPRSEASGKMNVKAREERSAGRGEQEGIQG